MDSNADAVKEITKMMAVINQDFKIPLTSVLFNLQSLKRILKNEIENSSELLTKKIESIETNANQLSKFLENLLDLGQTHISEIHMRKNLTHTHDLLSDVAIASKKIFFPSIVEVEQVVPHDYCTINCDRDRIIQVFTNLIGKLLSFNPSSGTVKINTSVQRSHAHFIVKMEECLLDTSHLNTFFDEFLQIKINNIETKSMGLALSKWIIQAHEGNIWIESRADLGTAFFIELPRRLI